MSALHIGINQGLQVVSAGVFIDEVGEQLARDEPRRRRVIGENIDHIFIIQVAGMPEEDFRQVIMGPRQVN